MIWAGSVPDSETDPAQRHHADGLACAAASVSPPAPLSCTEDVLLARLGRSVDAHQVVEQTAEALGELGFDAGAFRRRAAGVLIPSTTVPDACRPRS